MDSRPRRRKPLIGKLFPSWGSSSADDSSRSRDDMASTTRTASTEFDPYQPEERDAIRQSEGAKARSEGLVERLRTLGQRLADETEAGSSDGSTNEDELGTITALQHEIATLQDELKVYRSTEWHPSSLLSMAPRTVGEFSHQQARLTWQSHHDFVFKGVIVVFNRYQQALDTFDIFPDTLSVTAPTSPVAAVDTVAGNPDAPAPPSAATIHASSSSPNTRRGLLPHRKASGATEDGHAAAAAAAAATIVSGEPGSPRPPLPRAPSTSSELSSNRGDSADAPHAVHEILDVNLVLQRRGTDPVTQPDTVRLYYFLRHQTETRYDCMFEFSLTVQEITAEMNAHIHDAGGLLGRRPAEQKALRPLTGRKSITDDLPRSPAMGTMPLLDKVETRRAPLLTFELVNATDGCEIRTVFKAFPTSSGDAVPSLASFVITLPVLKELGGLLVRRIREPVLTSKTVQNFWFRLEVELPDTNGTRSLGPFLPAEEHLALEESHYYLQQEVPLANVCILGASNRIEKRSPYETVYRFKYYYRDRAHTGTSMFQLAVFEIAQAEIVKSSQGFQKIRHRFRLEKQVELGLVSGTFHFYVREEVIPEPSTSGEPLNPVTGMWILERVSVSVRVV